MILFYDRFQIIAWEKTCSITNRCLDLRVSIETENIKTPPTPGGNSPSLYISIGTKVFPHPVGPIEKSV